MIPEWASRFLGESDIAEYDPRSGEPVAWGREVIEKIPEDLFDAMKAQCDMECVFPKWYLVEKRLEFADVLMKCGGVRAVGLGPGGGFKWVRMADDTTWGHRIFKTGALEWLERNPRLLVRCDKDGNEKGKAARIPRVSMGRSSASRISNRGRGRR
jgi:hypothetical protein